MSAFTVRVAGKLTGHENVYYQRNMASLQRHKVKGYSYFRIVESRRVNGKPRVFVIAHLGKADDLLKRLQAADALQIRSRAHGAVAALHAMAQEIDLVGIIDAHLAASGKRERRSPIHRNDPERRPERNHGLTVGQSLMLIAIGRACHATSKSGFAEWAESTTLGELAGVDLRHLTSQHFWDQMDQLPIEIIPTIEADLLRNVLQRFELTLDTLLFDATNFFTFIASTNTRPKLPARGHQKQKRDDLRQVSVAVLCSRREGIPLWHRTYGGQVADATCFAEVLPMIQQRLGELGRDLESLTIVYDKGNVSRANQKLVDQAKLHYVTAIPNTSQEKLVTEANAALALVDLGDGQKVSAYRARKQIWGAERTAVVLVSERLREGQMRGILQHVASARRWLDKLANTLRRGKQKRNRARIERDIELRLKGRQHLSRVLRFQLVGDDPRLSLTYQFDQASFDDLANNTLGRIVLMTDRHDWSTPEIIRTYRNQADIEALFAHLKDPNHLALRPQRHWTDQKLHVHVMTCMLGYMLARLLHLRALRAGAPFGSPEGLLEALGRVRRATVARSTNGSGALRISTQFEDAEPDLRALLPALSAAS
jgi:transposase